MSDFGVPIGDAWLVCVENNVDQMMAFSSGEEAQIYAEIRGGEVLPLEPIFHSAADCLHWCHGLDSIDVEKVIAARSLEPVE